MTGFGEANAQCLPPLVHMKTETLKDDMMGLKDTGLLICKTRNLGSKTCDSKSYSSR